MRVVLAFLMLLALSAPAPAQQRERTTRTETVAVAFTGFERGDYLWANFIDRRRRQVTAMVTNDRLGAFLAAHRGLPITITVATVRTTLPEAGRTTVRRLTGARNAAGTAERWWGRLNPAQRRAAQARFERAAR